MPVDKETAVVSMGPVGPASAEAVAEAVDAFTGRTDYPLVVVTVATKDGDERSGCLAGFVTQCSILPPRLLVCISKVNHTYAAAEAAEAMAVHLLGTDQVDMASLFGEQTGDSVDKFDHCRWHTVSTGAPILDECAAWLEGSIINRLGVGDHEAFVVSVVAGGPGRHDGLLTLKGSPHFSPGHPADD
jgi:flavin reductase (DIM6/NTAB) family NADH-FMN oxidoreductase RutF